MTFVVPGLKNTVPNRISVALLLALLLSYPALAQRATPEQTAKPSVTALTASVDHGPHLDVDQITVPLDVIKGYTFIEGSVNGTRGKLLFDVGAHLAFTVDNHTVPVPDGKVIGKSQFGSGQTFETLRFPKIDSLTLAGGLHFENMTEIMGNAGLPLEQHITPDFIGWIGVAFWKGYTCKLDYRKPAVTFYRDHPAGAGERAAEAGEHVLQTIKVESNPIHLFVFPIKIGDSTMNATLDTGAHNAIWMTDEEKAALIQTGSLQPADEERYTLSGVTIDGRPQPPMAFDIIQGRPPFSRLVNHPDTPMLQFGYEFLSQYKTVWDYDQSTFTLLAQ